MISSWARELRNIEKSLVVVNTWSDAIRMQMITLRELKMMRLMNDITDKPDWDLKVCVSDSSQESNWTTKTGKDPMLIL